MENWQVIDGRYYLDRIFCPENIGAVLYPDELGGYVVAFWHTKTLGHIDLAESLPLKEAKHVAVDILQGPGVNKLVETLERE